MGQLVLEAEAGVDFERAVGALTAGHAELLAGATQAARAAAAPGLCLPPDAEVAVATQEPHVSWNAAAGMELAWSSPSDPVFDRLRGTLEVSGRGEGRTGLLFVGGLRPRDGATEPDAGDLRALVSGILTALATALEGANAPT